LSKALPDPVESIVSHDFNCMTAPASNERSIESPSWTKRLTSIWSTENIKIVRRVIVSVIGATVLLIGIALLVLPGPAFIVIPVGLAILATEYAWARRWLKKARQMASNVVSSRNKTASGDTHV
jgi:tellurite resistance protein TerC